MRVSIRRALRDPEARREMEKESMTAMIRMYCHGNHHTRRRELCPKCREFEAYARMRTDKCPFMKTKTFCTACKVHCYSKDWKPYVREVMRYSGPRLIFTHPILVVLHGCVMLKQKIKMRKDGK